MFVQTNKCDTFMITMGENTKQMNEQQQQKKKQQKTNTPKKTDESNVKKDCNGVRMPDNVRGGGFSQE